MIMPETEVRLLNIPIDKTQKNQLTFNSRGDQYTYMNSRVKKSYTDFTYQRKDNVIRIPTGIDSLWNCNYVMYKNNNYDKWFYAFITKKEFLEEDLTAVYIETDPWQTWFSEIQLKTSFVEREHVTDDGIGIHTVPENVETGNYVCNSSLSLYDGSNNTYICVNVTEVPSEVNVNTYNAQYNGVYSGTIALLFDEPLGASNFIRAMDKLAKKDAITSIYLIPTSLCGNPSFNTVNIDTGDVTITTHLAVLPYSTDVTTLNTSGSVTTPSSLNGYTPKNNKLFTYPYNYFYITNNVGSDVEFHYEDFVNNSASFKTIGSVTPGCSIRCVPLNYKKLSDSNSLKSYNYGVTCAKYPICSWASDVYTNWLTQNGLNLTLQFIGSAGAIIGGGVMLATGAGAVAGVGAIAGGVTGIANSISQVYENSLTPKQAQGNSNAGDVTFSSDKMGVTCYKMTLRSEYAEIIDKFFTMFGYKVNTVKIPNINSRAYFNYVKTIDCNITGDIPMEDLILIKQIFDNGCTFWKNANYVGDYSVNNVNV